MSRSFLHSGPQVRSGAIRWVGSWAASGLWDVTSCSLSCGLPGISLPGFSHFDPAPFSLLGLVVTLEASFILMRQARLARRADERDHLMLQVLLLTEKEITAVLKMERQIASEMGLAKGANTAEVRELSQHTSIEDVAQTIRETVPLWSRRLRRLAALLAFLWMNSTGLCSWCRFRSACEVCLEKLGCPTRLSSGMPVGEAVLA